MKNSMFSQERRETLTGLINAWNTRWNAGCFLASDMVAVLRNLVRCLDYKVPVPQFAIVNEYGVYRTKDGWGALEDACLYNPEDLLISSPYKGKWTRVDK